MKTLEALRAILDERFNGVLYSGTHRPDGKCCLLEFASQAKGIRWTDSPVETGYPDLRPLNDAPWSSDEVRTEAMLPLLVSLAWWADADEARRKRFTDAVAFRTIREVLPIALRAAGLELPAVRCESAKDLAEAADAAAAAYAAAADKVLTLTCLIWHEEGLRV